MITLSPKPFSQACVNNAEPILGHLRPLLKDARSVLEIGSGTGQHAVYFGKALPDIVWQTSDRPQYLPGIHQWLVETQLPNVLPPIHLDITGSDSPGEQYGAVFMANTLHIMPRSVVARCMARIPEWLKPGGLLIVYGPFNYHGAFTSDSNARFDAQLKQADAEQGIRDFEWINQLALNAGFEHREGFALPANNRLLVWCFKG